MLGIVRMPTQPLHPSRRPTGLLYDDAAAAAVRLRELCRRNIDGIPSLLLPPPTPGAVLVIRQVICIVIVGAKELHQIQVVLRRGLGSTLRRGQGENGT